ncbi:MAG: HAMP domain-containing protein [Hyellaceae cyanobacterium CSU_1_1]|nr:HAMP domain-containing protein [Hyellaceae cyanobacterium CSU_1_1]
MSLNILHKLTKSYRNLSLQNIITLPFLLQIFITVGLVGYFSWRNGEQAVNNVTSQLTSEVTDRVEKQLENYLKTPHLIVNLKQNSVRTGQLNINNFSTVQQDFWLTLQLFDTARAIYIGDETGKFRYSKRQENKFYSQEVKEIPQRKTYVLDNLGQKRELIKVDQYDPKLRPWYINTLKTQGNNWSNIYTFTGGELGITAAGLLRDRQGDIQGIVGVDLILSGIDRFLENIEISKKGQVFILERNGYLVATSTQEKPFTYDALSKKEKRLRAIDSKSLLVKETTAYITKHFQSLYKVKHSEQLEFQLKNNDQLVQVVPYQDELGLDWLIVLVMPKADFMNQIQANTLNTIWLCLIASAIATVLGIYTSRRIAKPIANLSEVTSAIAESATAKNTSTNLYPIIKVNSVKELQSLAKSFNEMVIQLKAAFRELEISNTSLENRVRQRTQALMTAKEAADAANRTKSQFLANMSHELRTPLHAILGFTQVALQDTSLKFQQKENLLTVKRSGEHLLTLINDILEMSKIEAGSLSVTSQPFNLHQLLDNLAKMFKLRALEKKIELTFNLPKDLPQYIETDPVKLNQILINLIENGIKFTSQGRVTLNLKLLTESNQTMLAFAVIDTGQGILPSHLESIFVPFIQTRQSEQQGTGLGLAICQQFARLLGGEIIVSSRLGQGSLFKFQIPITIVKQVKHQATLTVQQPAKSYSFFPKQEQELATFDLTNMPIEWIKQLHQAAIAIDSELILQLIKQISLTEPDLAAGLTRMLKNFEYDEMVELIERSWV